MADLSSTWHSLGCCFLTSYYTANLLKQLPPGWALLPFSQAVAYLVVSSYGITSAECKDLAVGEVACAFSSNWRTLVFFHVFPLHCSLP